MGGVPPKEQWTQEASVTTLSSDLCTKRYAEQNTSAPAVSFLFGADRWGWLSGLTGRDGCYDVRPRLELLVGRWWCGVQLFLIAFVTPLGTATPPACVSKQQQDHSEACANIELCV